MEFPNGPTNVSSEIFEQFSTDIRVNDIDVAVVDQLKQALVVERVYGHIASLGPVDFKAVRQSFVKITKGT